MTEKILVLGLSKSGIAAAKLGISLGYDVYITEGKKEVNELQVLEFHQSQKFLKGYRKKIFQLFQK